MSHINETVASESSVNAGAHEQIQVNLSLHPFCTGFFQQRILCNGDIYAYFIWHMCLKTNRTRACIKICKYVSLECNMGSNMVNNVLYWNEGILLEIILFRTTCNIFNGTLMGYKQLSTSKC